MEHSDNPVTTKPSSIKVIDLEDDDLWPPNNAASENEFHNVEDYDSDDSFPVIPNTFPVSKVLSRNKTQNPKLPYEAILKVHKEMPKESIVSWELMTKAQRITTSNNEVQSIWFAKDADARKPRIDNIQNSEPFTVKSATPECVYTPENLTRILSTVSKSKSNASINFVMSGIMAHGRVSDELLQSVTIDPSQKDRYHNEIVYPFHPYGSENKNHHTLNKRMTNANAIYNVPVNNDDQELTCLWKSCNTVVRGMHHFVNHVFIKHVEMTTNLKCQWDSCTRVTPFTAQYMLILHLRRHTGERPHVCYYTNCHKSYSRLENLKTHIRTHTGERPYRCENGGCEKTFYNASDRAKHQSRTHGAAKSFECYVVGCKKIYTDPSSLRKHIKSIHGVACYDLVKRAKMQQLREGRRYRIYIPTVAVAESVMELCSEDDLKQRGIIVENEVEPVVESYIFCEDDEDLSMYFDEVKSDDNQSQQIQPNVIDSNGRYSCDEEFIDVVSVSPQPSTSRDSGIEATSSRSGTVCSDISFSGN